MVTKSVIFTRHVDTPFMKMVFWLVASPLVKLLPLVFNSIYNTAKSNILYIFELKLNFSLRSHTSAIFGIFRRSTCVSMCLDAWRHRIQISKNLPYQYTELYLSLVLSSILFVWKRVSVSKNEVEIFHILPWMWHKTKVNVDDQNGQLHSPVWFIWKVRFHTIFFLRMGSLKLSNQMLIWLCLDFQENQKEFLTSCLLRTQYLSKVLLTIWFSTWWQVAIMNEENISEYGER